MSVLARFRRWLTKDEEKEEDPALILYNPVTKEQYTVTAPPRTHVYCGFYYHSPSKEYRILYQLIEFDPHNPFRLALDVVEFLVFSLQTQVMKVLKLQKKDHHYSNKIKKVTRTTRRPDAAAYAHYYHPDPSTPPVISNGFLHWIVKEKGYHQLPHCSHTILCFGMESEDFRLMPHPKLSHACSPSHRHNMNLLEMDGGILCLCDGYYSGGTFRSTPILEIYVMEDYKKWTWVRRYVIDLSNYIHYGCQYGFYYKALQILKGDQLLLHYHPCITNPYIDSTQQLQFRRRPDEYALYSLNHQVLRPAVASSSTGMMVRKSSKKKNKRQRFQVSINGYPGDNLVRRMIIDPKKKKRTPIVMGNMVVHTPSLASFQHNRSSTAPGNYNGNGNGTGTFFSIRINQ